MNLEALRAFCLSLPHAAEKLQWGDHLLFTVANKMFCTASLDAASATKIAFRASPERFAELTEHAGIIPAPYLARHHWVALTEWDALPARELRPLLRESYALVVAKLPKRVRAGISLESR